MRSSPPSPVNVPAGDMTLIGPRPLVPEIIRFDRGYLAARSLRRDLSVLARTVVCVARGTGR
jgi:lipopolysaccharide/colanic/teichoic acid biosynthesis glycosyltransferase